MKQNIILRSLTVVLASAILVFTAVNIAYASVTPTLSLSATGTSDLVTITVNGDANASVIMYYTPTNSALQISAIGTTNGSGYFSKTVNSSTYNLKTGNPVYVSTGGVNGLVSSTVNWPTVNTTTTTNPITLSNAGLVLSVGQISNITVTNTTSGTLYISNNSNSAVASAVLSNNQITLLALGYGSTAVTVCATGYTSNCPVLYITVQNGGSQALTLSQTSVSLTYGQSAAITITGGTGSYIVSNNPSSGNVSSSINGNIVVLGGNSNTSGTYAITVCSSDMSSCGIINVTLGSTSSTNVLFGNTAPVLSVGQTLTVSVYGTTNTTYYVSSNSNASVALASISGSVLTLTGVTNGTAILNICATAGGCSSLTVTVSGSAGTGSVYLSQNSMTLAVGQTSSVTLSNGTAPYVLLTASNTIFQAGISGNQLLITGAGAGSATITVCSTGGTGCSSLSLTVTSTQTNTNSSTGTTFLTFNQTNPTLTIGQSMTITVTGGSGSSYTIPYNSNASTVQASVSGSTLSLYGLRNGSVVLVVCDGANDCGAVTVSVGSTNTNTGTTSNPITTNGLYPSGCASAAGYSITTGQPCGSGTTTTTTTTTTATTKYQFTLFLQEGTSGSEVLELQKKLTSLGYFSGPLNGNFGPMTKAAVAAFQRAHGVSAVGYVGPSTRAMLNAY